MYGTQFEKNLVTSRTPSLIFVRHESIFRATQNFFNQFNIYLYATGTIFCKHVFVFCATLNIFRQHEFSFGCHIIFFVVTTYIFVTHIILLHNVNFTQKFHIFFLFDTIVFSATQDFFVLPNVTIGNKEKQICSH